jgi:hypothetical protein
MPAMGAGAAMRQGPRPFKEVFAPVKVTQKSTPIKKREAGLYVTAGTKVTIIDGSEERTAKAVELSGQPNLLFRRNSLNGRVEVLPRTGAGITLNAALHTGS